MSGNEIGKDLDEDRTRKGNAEEARRRAREAKREVHEKERTENDSPKPGVPRSKKP